MGDPKERPHTEDKGNKNLQIIAKAKHITSRIYNNTRDVLIKASTWQTVTACALGVLLIGGSIYYYNYRKTGYEVLYHGESLGYVKDKEVAVEALKAVEEHIQKYDPEIDVDQELQFEKMLVESDRLTTGDKIVEMVEADLLQQNTAYTISVNGNEMAVVATEEKANQVIAEVKKCFEEQEAKENIKVLEVNIKDQIEIEKCVVDKSKLTDADNAISVLTSSKGTTKQYEVVSGDSIWRIARDNDMSISDITAINPGIDIEKLKLGQIINLSISEPYLNVETVLEAKVNENIKYNTTYISDSNIYRGQSKVVTSGQYGIKETVKKITKLNGKEVTSEVLSASVVKEPVTQVVARGTKPLVGSGAFSWPISGHVTSAYGSRGREYHRGMDIAAPRGTTIKAADSGTVKFAGWYYGYGKLVIIDHGNGYETYYGHCSSISVEKGQSVTRGQKIAEVGSTGDSTGNHVHFEIRKNGSTKNPSLYLP